MTVDLADVRTWLPSHSPEMAAHMARFWTQRPMVVEHVEPDEPLPFGRVGVADESGGSPRLATVQELQERAGKRAWDTYRSVWAGGGY